MMGSFQMDAAWTEDSVHDHRLDAAVRALDQLLASPSSRLDAVRADCEALRKRLADQSAHIVAVWD